MELWAQIEAPAPTRNDQPEIPFSPSPPVLRIYPSRLIEEPDAFQLNLRLALVNTTVKDYGPCLVPQADDPELTSRSKSISA